MRNHHLIPILGALATVLAVSSDASASVSNWANSPFYLNLDTGQDSIWLGPTNQFSLMDSSAIMNFDVASNGDLSNFFTYFPMSPTTLYFGANQVSAQLLVDDSQSSGHVLGGASNNEISISLRARVKFQFTGSGNCFSQYFNVTLSTTKTFTTGGGSLSGNNYDLTAGGFRAVASDFTPPNMHSLTTGCGTQINRDNLGAAFFGPNAGPAAGDSGIKFDNARITDPAVLSP